MKLKIAWYGKSPIIMEGVFLFAGVLYVNIDGFMIQSLLFLPLLCGVIWDYIKSCATYTFDSSGVTIQLLNSKKKIRWEDFKEKQLLYTNKGGIGYMLPYRRCARFSLYENATIRELPPNVRAAWFYGNVWGDVYVYFNDDIPKKQRCAIDTNEEEFLRKLEEWGVKLQTKIVY